MFRENEMIYWNDDISRETLQEMGFNDNNYFMRYVHGNISLNVSKRDNILKIDVLDEAFLQPYDYQYILKRNPNHKFANNVKKKVDEKLYEMQEKGIISGFDSNNYVYSKYSKSKCYD